MMDTLSERIKRTVHRLSASQSIAVVMVLLVVASLPAVAMAFSQINPDRYEYASDFEDGTVQGWSDAGVATDSYQEQYSIYAPDTDIQPTAPNQTGWGGSSTTVRFLYVGRQDTNVQLQADFGLHDLDGKSAVYISDITGTIYLESDSNYDTLGGETTYGNYSYNSRDTWTNVEMTVNTDETVEVYIWEAGTSKPSSPQITGNISGSYSTTHGTPFMDRDGGSYAYLDEVAYDDLTTTGVKGIVRDTDQNRLANATVNASQSGTVIASTETLSNGRYSLDLDNGTYDVTASKQGYFPESEQVTVNGSVVTQDFTLRNKSESLIIDTDSFLEHGETVDYTIYFESKADNGTRLVREDVTANTSLLSGNTSVLTVNTFEHTITGTSDSTVNQRTYVEANYTDPDDNETYVTTKNITVANRTVDNFDILPPWQRLYASLEGGTDENRGDRTLLILIIGTAAASAVAIFATSFAGVATLTAFMMAGWIIGMVSDGVAIATVFIALFIGLNVAGNVDYTVRR